MNAVSMRMRSVWAVVILAGLTLTLSGGAAAQRNSNRRTTGAATRTGARCQRRPAGLLRSPRIHRACGRRHHDGGRVAERRHQRRRASRGATSSSRARVVGTAATEEEARAIAARVQIVATADRVTADGPRNLGRRDGWHVSYRLDVPTQTPLSLRTTNGGITHRQREQPRRVQDRQRRSQAVAHGRGRRRAHDQRRRQRGPRRRHLAGGRTRRADLERRRAPVHSGPVLRAPRNRHRERIGSRSISR